jgi:hypothetical protein
MNLLEQLIKETDPSVAEKKDKEAKKKGLFIRGVSNTHPFQVIHRAHVERYAGYLLG